MENDTKQEWDRYVAQELHTVRPILARLGFTFTESQPHLGGERYLTGTGRKLVLLAYRTADNKRVVIKTSSDPRGIAEIEHEHICREVLENISFAYQVLLSPVELFYLKENGCVVQITEFIEQQQSFLERPLEEQFLLALKAFKAQESAHATTYKHVRTIKNTFGEINAYEYYIKIQQRVQDIVNLLHDKKDIREGMDHILDEAIASLCDNQVVLEQYGGFLTHWDFTPQNIRIKGQDIYLLDHSSLRFGNKYEGWARFVNFMVLYNPPLARACVQYVRDNRTPEESLSLKLMRIYRLVELIHFYATWLPKTNEDLHELAQARIDFWGEVLTAVLADEEVPVDTIENYKHIRNSLRSEEESERQKGLH